MIAEAPVLRNHTTESQCARILDWITSGKKITPLVALEQFGCNRLAARINQLRAEGHDIQTDTITVINRHGGKCRVAEYSLVRRSAARDGAA